MGGTDAQGDTSIMLNIFQYGGARGCIPSQSAAKSTLPNSARLLRLIGVNVESIPLKTEFGDFVCVEVSPKVEFWEVMPHVAKPMAEMQDQSRYPDRGSQPGKRTRQGYVSR